jgi:flagellin
MAFSLISNLSSLESQSRLNVTGAKLNQAVQRLSSGLRINMSGDDAAGLAIANKFRSDISVLSQGVRNANDGLSTLQVLDGGLNTISGLLDRAATLAAQSASDTFSGNRATLNNEFSKVISEITRQSQNIGLNSGGRNNASLTTIIGGGSDSFAASNSNQGVQVDLSGAASAVDAASLGLSSLSIGAISGSVTGTAAMTTLTGAETLSFRVPASNGSLGSPITVALANGDNAAQVVNKINDSATLQAAGVSASVDSNGRLVLTGSSYFQVSSSLAGGAGTTRVGSGANQINITNAASHADLTMAVAANASTQYVDITVGSTGVVKRIAFATDAASAATTATNLQSAIAADSDLQAAGIYGVVTSGANIQIASANTSFTVNVENSDLGGDVTDGGNAVAAGATSVTAGTGVSGGSASAKAAIDAIQAAVATLGVVQGVVGAGENRLLQAVDLATSQITNFQAAESRIRDADVAAEASTMSRLTVLQQAGVAALAQANQSSQAVLSLLR